MCASHCSASRNYVVGDPEEYCRGYSQTVLLENNKESRVLVMFLHIYIYLFFLQYSSSRKSALALTISLWLNQKDFILKRAVR